MPSFLGGYTHQVRMPLFSWQLTSHQCAQKGEGSNQAFPAWCGSQLVRDENFVAPSMYLHLVSPYDHVRSEARFDDLFDVSPCALTGVLPLCVFNAGKLRVQELLLLPRHLCCTKCQPTGGRATHNCTCAVRAEDRRP